ncbi:MAG: dihydrolipoamide acetyltransferase family protein [Caldilineaceae bacterium]
MATEVKLPDLGEGVEDATINRWLVKEGDEVKAGDVILEVATDKVDTEVPAPAGGKVLKLVASEGSIVDLNTVLAIIGAEGESIETDGAAPTAQPAAKEGAPAKQERPASTIGSTPAANGVSVDGQELKATPVAKRVAAEKGLSLSGIAGTGPGGQITKEDVLARVDRGGEGGALPDNLADIAPLEVRRAAAEHNVDLTELAAGRPLSSLTRYDVLNAIGAGQTQFLPPAGTSAPAPAAQPAGAAAPTPAAAPAKVAAPAAPTPKVGVGDELVKPTRMRQLIAQNTFASLQSSPQLTTWHDVDMSAVIAHRKAHKGEFAQSGVNLTVTAYLIAATIAGLQAVPAANGMWTDEGILIRRSYHIGMAVAMPADKYGLGGLIVPVIRNAGDLNLLGIARQVNDLAEKARANKITGEDLQGGTFTLTNYGTSGSVFQTPIIHQGQAGILGTGAIEKRPVVVSNGSPLEANMGDYLTFKPMLTLALTFDHRVLDGATADAFCVVVKKTLEQWQ